MRNYLFLGFAIPDDEMQKVFGVDEFPAAQTHKFNWNLIKGLEACGEFDCTYISTRAVSDYPYYPKLVIRGQEWVTRVGGRTIRIHEIPFVNSSVLKLLTRFVTGLLYSVIRYHRERNKGGVIVYSVHVPYMMIGYILSRLYGIDYIAVWTDPPSVHHSRESWLKARLRRIELRISLFLMKRVSKVVALTRYLAEDFAPGRPYLVMEGIVDESESRTSRDPSRSRPKLQTTIVYTGSLDARCGIENIVKAIRLLKRSDVLFDVYGCGDYEQELIRACSQDARIRYRGYVTSQEALRAQREADFLINARSPDDEYTRYSFPSKTLEYLLSGTPLITTLLPGMPSEYRDYVLPIDDNDPQTIAASLERAIALGEEQRRTLGYRAMEFAKTRDYIVQGKRVAAFIVASHRRHTVTHGQS
jgi:glycosyltransferase involved in cell wall biosynthesis